LISLIHSQPEGPTTWFQNTNGVIEFILQADRFIKNAYSLILCPGAIFQVEKDTFILHSFIAWDDSFKVKVCLFILFYFIFFLLQLCFF
jgi:hypothetical protein